MADGISHNLKRERRDRVPTEDKTVLSDEEIEEALAHLPGWRREGKFLKKTYLFDSFKPINPFLKHLVDVVVTQNHHPDVVFRPGEKKFEIATSTHSHGAITRADVALAEKLERFEAPK